MTGYIDSVQRHFVFGWAELEGAPVDVDVFVNGDKVEYEREPIFRTDLASFGYNPEAGFKLHLSKGLISGDVIEVKKVGGAKLAGSPVEFVETERPRVPVERSPLLFCHVPKSGGTSLRKYIEHNSKKVIGVYDNEHQREGFARKVSEEVPLIISGHFSYGLHLAAGCRPRYFTILRDPVERLISLYRFSDFYSSPQFREKFDNKIPGFVDLIESGASEQTNNHMCRIIAGIDSDEPTVINDPWLLEAALYNIRRHFEFVGILDYIDDAGRRLSRMFNWPNHDVPKENANNKSAIQITSAEKSAAERYNRLDIELYRIMKADYERLMRVGPV